MQQSCEWTCSHLANFRSSANPPHAIIFGRRATVPSDFVPVSITAQARTMKLSKYWTRSLAKTAACPRPDGDVCAHEMMADEIFISLGRKCGERDQLKTALSDAKRKPGWFARLFLRRVKCGYIHHGATGRMLASLKVAAPTGRECNCPSTRRVVPELVFKPG